MKTSAFYRIAKRERDVQELPGAAANADITEYLSTTTLSQSLSGTDETPWCSGFTNWVVTKAGVKGTNRADAVSWMNWGVPTADPRKGSIVVFKWANGGHHVGFYGGKAPNGKIYVLGGNQSNKVTISEYDPKYVMGYRDPENNFFSRMMILITGSLGIIGIGTAAVFLIRHYRG